MGGLNETEHGDFSRFWDRSKNVIFGFLGVEKLIKIFVSSSRIIQNFEKIDLQNWNLREFSRAHVTVFFTFFTVNIFVWHHSTGQIGSRNLKVKRGHFRSNLKFRPKNSFTMTRIDLSHQNVSIYVIWSDKSIAGVKFHLRLFGVKWGHFYENRLFKLVLWLLAAYSINYLEW